MERELWPAIYRRVMGAADAVRQVNVTFQPHIIVLVFAWAALHDRPVGWACLPRNWSTTTLRPAGLPSPSTLSRRLKSIAVGVLMRHIEGLLRAATIPGIVQVIDGKPLPVGGASHDPDARNGHGAGKIAKGYKLHAIWGRAAVPEAWSVEPLNVCETKAAEAVLAAAPGPGGYLLGDGEYDATAVYDAAGAAGYQLVAPREDPNAGLGHRRQSPYRLRSIELQKGEFGAALYAARRSIERQFGNATSFAGGLAPLPAWVRRLWRVWRWTWVKLMINGVRIAKKQGLTSHMQ
jgi:Transposase DDE domain